MGKDNKHKLNKNNKHKFGDISKATKIHEEYANVYLPDERTGYHPNDEDLVSKAPNGDITPIPNPASDPIVSQNISNQEFDYTESMFDEMNDFEDAEGINRDVRDKK